MSLKQEIETWVNALSHYDSNEFDAALRSFFAIADTSKILFNCGVIHATLGEHAQAVECYQRAVQLDQYLAIAYFQQGVSNFLMGDFEEALANFNDTLLYLRGNKYIDYDQLGLKFKLHSCEALFNRGLCYIYLQQKDAGLQDLMFAAKEKAVADHDVIDEAIKEYAEGYTVFSIPIGIVYRPNEAKVKNLKTKDYLGKARLVAAQDVDSSSVRKHRRNLSAATFAVDDRPEEKLSYAALNLVRPNLASRARQRSEPPIHRSIFPPTPPPEAERPMSMISKRRSTESTSSGPSGLYQTRPFAPKPQRLQLGAAAFEQQAPERPRLATIRSAYERPPERKEHDSQHTDNYEKHAADRRSLREIQHQLRPDVYNATSGKGQHLIAEQPQQQSRSLSYRSKAQSTRQHQMSIEEEQGEAEETRSTASALSTPSSNYAPTPQSSNLVQLRSTRRRSSGRRPLEVRRIRVKVYADDTRYVMISPDASFSDFAEQVRKKFNFASVERFKLKMPDEEGDMVTLADQDDLDMAIADAKNVAGREGSELGKMDIWVQEL